MKFTYVLMMVFTTGSCSGSQQNGAKVVKDKPVIQSEKIIYYDIEGSKSERSYDFGKDLFKEYDRSGKQLKESIILVDEQTQKETINLGYLYHYQNGKLSKGENYSVLRGGIKKEEVQFIYNAGGKLEKEVHDAFEDGKKVLNKNCFYILYSYGKNDTEDHFSFNEGTQKFELSYRTLKEFDLHKNLVKEIDYDPQNEPYRSIVRTYNDINQIIRERRVDQYSDVDESTVYNDEGDILKITTKDGGEMIYTYKYDQYNNWIEKTEKIISVSNGKSEISANHLIKRSIIYY